ncbi:MAG: hypothetical protein AB8B97_26300 [Granulosicoccus sp.]
MTLFTASFADVYSDQFSLLDIKGRLFICHPLMMIVLAEEAAPRRRFFFERKQVAHVQRLP